MITREQVADLREGDFVELSWPTTSGHPGVTMTARGPLRSISGETCALFVGCYAVRDQRGAPVYGRRRTLTVVSRAPRPLYVNHPRIEPVPGDVVRDADKPDDVVSWARTVGSQGNHGWRHTGSANSWCYSMPGRLRLLVDGETGQVAPVKEPSEATVPRRFLRSAHAEGWAEGFESATEWCASNPGPSGIPHDPPTNPYDGEVAP